MENLRDYALQFVLYLWLRKCELPYCSVYCIIPTQFCSEYSVIVGTLLDRLVDSGHRTAPQTTGHVICDITPLYSLTNYIHVINIPVHGQT